MKKIFPVILVLFLCFNCKNESTSNDIAEVENSTEMNIEKPEFAIIIHGGAGTILKKNMTPEKEAAYKAKLEEAIRVGYEILKNGGSSLDAVEKTWDFLTGMVVFLSIKRAIRPPLVSKPRERGVTSSRRTSLTSPARTPP